MPLNDTFRALSSPEPAAVTSAALKLGLLLEQARFRSGGKGTLGDTTSMLGDLVDIELTDEQFQSVLVFLMAHVEERGAETNPTVVWAIGKAGLRAQLDKLERLADLVMSDPHRQDLSYQLVSVLATAAPEHRTILLRAAKESVGDARALAVNLIHTHGWE